MLSVPNAGTRILLRPTDREDLPFVIATERHLDNAFYVGQWSLDEHEAALAAEDMAHFIGEHDGQPIGYLILTELSSRHQTINLRRIVVTRKRQGYGRAMLRWVKHYAFETLGCHRLWLDVLAINKRARSLYASEGFIEEGLLRESWKTDTGYESLVIMSMLRSEYLVIGL